MTYRFKFNNETWWALITGAVAYLAQVGAANDAAALDDMPKLLVAIGAGLARFALGFVLERVFGPD